MDGERDYKVKRIASEQREIMLDFMKAHPTLATGRFTAPDGARNKQRLLVELASLLNSCPSGVSKSEEKWLKSWQDCRSDVKAKASLLRREMNKTGGGQINPKAKPLTPLEEQLLSFLGPNVVTGHEEVIDPITLNSNAADGAMSSNVQSDGGQSSVILFDGVIDDPSMFTIPSAPFIPIQDTPCESPAISDKSSSTSSGSKKGGKRSRTSTICSDEYAPDENRLLKVSEDRLEVEKGKFEFVKEMEKSKHFLAKQKLRIERRYYNSKIRLLQEQTDSNRMAAESFCSAMLAVQNYFLKKADS